MTSQEFTGRGFITGPLQNVLEPRADFHDRPPGKQTPKAMQPPLSTAGPIADRNNDHEAKPKLISLSILQYFKVFESPLTWPAHKCKYAHSWPMQSTKLYGSPK